MEEARQGWGSRKRTLSSKAWKQERTAELPGHGGRQEGHWGGAQDSRRLGGARGPAELETKPGFGQVRRGLLGRGLAGEACLPLPPRPSQS